MSSIPREGLSRRDFLRVAAGAATGAGAAAILPGIRAEAARPPVIQQEVKYFERFPGVPFNPLQIEGEPVELTLGDEPIGFHFPAHVGRRIEVIIKKLEGDDFIISELYGPGMEDKQGSFPGYPVLTRQTRLRTDIVAEGEYLLMVSRKQRDLPVEGNKISVRVEDDYKHGIQTSFLLSPNRQPTPVIFSPDVRQVLPTNAFGVILDFNEPALHPDDWKIKIYAQKGSPKELASRRARLAEDDPANEVPYLEDWLGSGKVIMFPAEKGTEGGGRGSLKMLEEWPAESQISVLVQNDKTGERWATRFFTL